MRNILIADIMSAKDDKIGRIAKAVLEEIKEAEI